ncbi:Fic family protein [Spiribacter roseus]|uniref:Fic family protein n=1 Tax=Spiribacter roseus TaxID=1855875 RepID=UPI001F38999F|nr:Fic family protein [Spiribacter roseus]
MHARLLARGRGARMQPGAFRRSQNWIGRTRPGNARFVPAPPEYVQDVMASLEAFLHKEKLPFSALIKAALAHVQIETIHPFLDGVRYDGDWEAWLDFFLEGVQVTATGAVDTADRLVTLFREDAQQIQNLGRASANTLRVFDALRSRSVASIKDLRRRSDLSAPTVGRAVDALEEMGVVDEITGRQRDRVYVYRRYLNILNEGAEPL